MRRITIKEEQVEVDYKGEVYAVTIKPFAPGSFEVLGEIILDVIEISTRKKNVGEEAVRTENIGGRSEARKIADDNRVAEMIEKLTQDTATILRKRIIEAPKLAIEALVYSIEVKKSQIILEDEAVKEFLYKVGILVITDLLLTSILSLDPELLAGVFTKAVISFRNLGTKITEAVQELEGTEIGRLEETTEPVGRT
jgi:hypothetical protein